MRILQVTLVAFLVVFLHSCKLKIGEKAISEGTMKYSITYLEDESKNPIISLMPSHLKMSFKNGSVVMEVEGWMGVFKTSFIKNGNSNEAITLLKMLNKKYCYRSFGSKGYLGFDANGKMNIEFDEEIKTILNYTCKHAKVTLPEKNITYDVYYTEEIGIDKPNEFTPYENIPGVLMEFQIEINGIPMYLIASEVNEIEIPDEVFDVPDDFEDVPREELEKIFTSLI